ncbi:TPA: helix-turn-helix transcriptional regulator [Citrobacter freundii]|uniref:helix-turn-helix domain-containing protein n=1 Tax=Citrobacter freundii TaxID=546 RepID=UPI0023AF75AE|nr:helix-turn-helix transcriptional regulator [Citrobacter freundii]WGA93280.1 helix-turn-helix transcriptional regulator [Citrobacter freundii]HBV9014858.1 helix-turn-helix transcriptional regulator [Citrobacter freundii]HCA7357762.1 helix-turn-helix transcriptional regulator [Citrobacter freundii]HCL5691932.1 helix-turn-helix transcriptional regulator [Citrobacter freundii]HED2997541.1 helix-turn-helix transcriptional regulator [Citrobacter freundii]
MNLAQKLRAIRKAEGFTQAKFSEISGIAKGTIKNYESGQQEPGIQVVLQITQSKLFEKYALWLMTDKTAPQAGQIAPALAHIGQDTTKSDQSEKQTG